MWFCVLPEFYSPSCHLLGLSNSWKLFWQLHIYLTIYIYLTAVTWMLYLFLTLVSFAWSVVLHVHTYMVAAAAGLTGRWISTWELYIYLTDVYLPDSCISIYLADLCLPESCKPTWNLPLYPTYTWQKLYISLQLHILYTWKLYTLESCLSTWQLHI